MILGRLMRVLGSRIWLILAILAVTLVTTAAGTLLTPKRYVATTSMLIDIPSKDPVLGSSVYLQGSIAALLAAQIELIGSGRVVDRVMNDLGLARDPAMLAQWRRLGDGKGDPDGWIRQRLVLDLKVEPARDAPLLKLSFEALDPTLAARVANGFAQAYIDATLGMKTKPARDYANLFETQTADARKRLADARERLSKFQRDSGITSGDETRDVENTRLQELSSQLVQLEAAAAAARSREATLRSGGPEAMPEVVSSQVLASIKTDIGRVRGRIEELSSRLGANHPQMIALQSELGDLNRRYQTELARVGDSISAEASINAQRAARTRAALESQKASVLALRQQRDQLAVLQREVDEAQKSVDLLSQRLTQTNIEANLGLSNVSVLSKAVAPTAPARPKPLLNMVVGGVLGLLLGAFAALTIEKVHSPVREADDLHRATGVPVLAVLTRSDSLRPRRLVADSGASGASDHAPPGADSEFRSLAARSA